MMKAVERKKGIDGKMLNLDLGDKRTDFGNFGNIRLFMSKLRRGSLEKEM